MSVPLTFILLYLFFLNHFIYETFQRNATVQMICPYFLKKVGCMLIVTFLCPSQNALLEKRAWLQLGAGQGFMAV